MRVVRKFARWIGIILTVLVLTVYFLRALDSRNMPQLDPEHRVVFEHEFDASQEAHTSWADYLAIEDKLAEELREKITDASRPESKIDRHSSNSLTSPDNYDNNWNHSFEVTASPQKGVAVLLHGLTDSPYSMLATAQSLAGSGYSVVVPRMPGHGFAVGGLLQARTEDWSAAVRIAVRQAMSRLEEDQPLLLGGYSNGALMAIDYALACDEIADLPCPDSLVLLSPAIAITPIARVANWHAALSWLPYFEQFKWSSILPEVDPFKFTSFPKRAAWEIYNISKRTHAQLEQAAEAAKLPPILTFQSLVDNTVTTSAIVTNLYNRLPANGSELVVYDVNRNSTLLSLMKQPPADPVDFFTSSTPLNYAVTVLRNKNPNSVDIDAVTIEAGGIDPVTGSTGLAWPTNIFSLSHIAIPFAANDEVYGDGSSNAGNNTRIAFGALAPRGESGVLELTPNYFLRARYNPFFAFQAKRISEWVGKRDSAMMEQE
jgi:alpha-beta hydrolase superfamily lysophospholipase